MTDLFRCGQRKQLQQQVKRVPRRDFRDRVSILMGTSPNVLKINDGVSTHH